MGTYLFETRDEADAYAADSKKRGCYPFILVRPDGLFQVEAWDIKQ